MCLHREFGGIFSVLFKFTVLICHSPLLVFPSTNPLYLPALIKIIRLTCSPQSAPNQLLHAHSLPDCHRVMLNPPALSSWRISWYLTLLLPPTTSPRHCPADLTHLLSLVFVSACSLPGLPLQRLLPHSERGLCSPARLPDCRLFGLLNFGNEVLNCSSLNLCCSWAWSHTHYNTL